MDAQARLDQKEIRDQPVSIRLLINRAAGHDELKCWLFSRVNRITHDTPADVLFFRLFNCVR